MKKLLFVCGTALTASLFADTSFLSGTGFEQLQAGAVNLVTTGDAGTADIYWDAASDTSDMTKIVAYGQDEADSTVAVPADNANFTPNAQYLEIDSGSTTLSRCIDTYGTELAREIGETGIYVDTMVQFTATETAPEVTQGDKLLVWLETQTDEQENTTLTLKVTAAAGNMDYTPTHYSIVGSYVENHWYRLTIVAGVEEVLGDNLATFKVYVDGDQVATADDVSLFYSLAGRTGTEAATIRQVGFKGKGAVDDLVFGTGDPFYVPATTFNYTVAYTDGVTGFTYAIDGGDAVSVTGLTGEGSTVIPVPLEGATTLSITAVTVATGYAEVDLTELTDSELDPTNPGTFELVTYKENFAIGEATYETLEDALVEVEDDSVVIKLLADYTLDEAEDATFYHDTTLNLNGKTLTLGENGLYVVDGGALTITDTVGGGVITADEVENSYIVDVSEGALVIDDANITFEGARPLAYVDVTSEDIVLTINGGKFAAAARPVVDNNELYTPESYKWKETAGYYTLVADGGEEEGLDPADPASSYASDAATEGAAEAAAKEAIVAPAGVDATEYAECFTYKVVGDTGAYTVTISGINPEKTQDVAEAAVDVLNEEEDAEVVVPAGLFYKITASAELGGEGTTVTGQSVGTALNITKPGTTQGFISIKLGATAADVK